MWPLPISEEMKGQGFYFPKIPELSTQDISIMLKDTSRVHKTSFNVNEFEHDPKDYVKKALQKYAGNTFLIPSGQDGTQMKEVRIPTEEEMNQKRIIVE